MRIPIKQAAVQALLLVAVLLASLHGQSAAPDQAPTPTPTPVAPPIKLMLTSLKPDAVIDVAADSRMSVAPDGVWVSSRSSGTLVRIDAKTNKPGAPVSTGPANGEPCQPVLVAFKSLWVPLCGSKQLYRLDVPVEKGAEKPAEKPSPIVAVEVRNPGPLASGTGSIWMISDTAGTLARIDPDTNAVVAEVSVPSGVSAMAFGVGALWITSASGDSVTRVNAATNVVEETIKVGKGPVSIAIGEGSVWTMNGGDSTVSRIDPKTNKVTETIKTGVAGASGTIVVGEGSVWLSASGTPLTRIDPVVNRMMQQFSGPGGGQLAIGMKSLWLGATPTAIWRIDPRRVEATRK